MHVTPDKSPIPGGISPEHWNSSHPNGQRSREAISQAACSGFCWGKCNMLTFGLSQHRDPQDGWLPFGLCETNHNRFSQKTKKNGFPLKKEKKEETPYIWFPPKKRPTCWPATFVFSFFFFFSLSLSLSPSPCVSKPRVPRVVDALLDLDDATSPVVQSSPGEPRWGVGFQGTLFCSAGFRRKPKGRTTIVRGSKF